MGRLLVFFLAISIAGCGSFATLTQSDGEVARELRQAETRCEVLPRPYSGVVYSFCNVHSNSLRFTRHALYPLYLFDMIPSLVVDTFALPYTLIRHYREGDLDLRSPHLNWADRHQRTQVRKPARISRRSGVKKLR